MIINAGTGLISEYSQIEALEHGEIGIFTRDLELPDGQKVREGTSVRIARNAQGGRELQYVGEEG